MSGATSKIKIVEGKKEHIPVLSKLFFNAFNEFYDSKEEAIADISNKQENNTLWVALIDGNVVGTLGYIREWSHNANYLEGLIIEPEYRELGIGSKLMKKFIEICGKEQKLQEYAFSSTNAENTTSIIFHKKLGFEECGIIKGLHFKSDEIFFRIKVK